MILRAKVNNLIRFNVGKRIIHAENGQEDYCKNCGKLIVYRKDECLWHCLVEENTSLYYHDIYICKGVVERTAVHKPINWKLKAWGFYIAR